MIKRSILIKAHINKAIIFIIIGIFILSCILNHLEIYNTKLQMTLGELIVLLFLIQNLLTKKCNYSLAAILILVAMSMLNIIYINTDIEFLNSMYNSWVPIIIYIISGGMFLRYCYEQWIIKKS